MQYVSIMPSVMDQIIAQTQRITTLMNNDPAIMTIASNEQVLEAIQQLSDLVAIERQWQADNPGAEES